MSLYHLGEKTPFLPQHTAKWPMYQYFYGSLDGSAMDVSIDSDSAAVDDLDVLAGEDLVSVKTTSKRSLSDLQQVPLTRRTSSGAVSFSNRSHRLRGSNSAATCIVCAFMTMAMICSVAVLIAITPRRQFPAMKNSDSNGSATDSSPFQMNFSRVNRGDFGDAIDSFLVPSLIHPNLINKDDTSHIFTFPFPTGAFWTNFVLHPTADRGLSYPIFVYPYGFKWSDTLLQVSYPYLHRNQEATAIHDYFFPDLTFGCNETIKARHITEFDPLSVSVQYETVNKGLWSVFLVQGSPYVTMEFGGIAPVIRALSTFENLDCPPPTLSLNSSLLSDGALCETYTNSTTYVKTASGVQFILKTQEGVFWLIFASEPLILELDMRVRITIRAVKAFNGALRVAVLPFQTNTDVNLTNSSALRCLVDHASVYPVNGDVSWKSDTAGTDFSSSTSTLKSLLGSRSGKSDTAAEARVATITMRFGTRQFSRTKNSGYEPSLLMLALPHHALRLPRSMRLGQEDFDLSFNSIKGRMTPVLGNAWTYNQPLVSPGFDNDSGSNNQSLFMEPIIFSSLEESLKEDIHLALPTTTENIYGFGKQAARLAQLALIASRLGANSLNTTSQQGSRKADSMAVLLTRATASLSAALEALLTDGVSDRLVYDANLGGLVSTDGLRNPGADFGNGRYNDHHFHYGYILCACAIMGKLDPSFVEKYKSQVDAIFYDVAYGSNFDSRKRPDGVFFPGARHMSWYDGHSYASGLFPFGNGKSQESSSEAVNCYYGAYLWSIVRNGADHNNYSDMAWQTDFARLLLSLEITGAQTYWHMAPKTNNTATLPSVYPEAFSRNYMVGNIGMNDAICSTWFGTNPLYVHMINFLPLTAASGELFGKEYAALEYNSVLASLGEVENAWRGFVVAHHAISDPNAAWEEALDLFSPTLDSGLSKTQVLYWISTRKGFAPRVSSSSEALNKSTTTQEAYSSDACEQNKNCAQLSLTGKCCPTTTGVMLGCC
ncbi:hypothetical protein ACA910_010680 [Epithemia clementina (nom. ined.)]